MSQSVRVLVTGAGGQLGRELLHHAPATVEVVACSRQDLDIADHRAVMDRVQGESPDWIINAAAYTAVDRAESEPDLAWTINAEAPGWLAEAAGKVGARLIQVSTDYVFSGEDPRHHAVGDPPSPINVYGRTKLEGERRVLAVLEDGVIVRTAWVYSRYGYNFVKTMLRLMAERDELRVVVDQLGTPTWARGLAQTLWSLVTDSGSPPARGIYHWTDAGVASWYDFAVAIQEESLGMGLLSRRIPLIPIATSAYPTPARRPMCSLLEKSRIHRERGLVPEHWRVGLRGMLRDH
ncbi:dTDP-4-dehydrorhamnose reductase [Ectothiorhodospira variabilis]|uniref:dTDP-4-dehydrorhamnose reductase n=1 Tax=Ectothiorhodospira variabilis TaxID=505694 RepID=UPI001EFAB966|nr:dTDP-4-dehydrorhamnose reductase [Ectothiorhodospira variabilis]